MQMDVHSQIGWIRKRRRDIMVLSFLRSRMREMSRSHLSRKLLTQRIALRNNLQSHSI